MPIYKMTDKNGKNIRKDGLQKYRVRINYTDSFGKSHQIDRVAFGAETAKQLEIQLTQKLNARDSFKNDYRTAIHGVHHSQAFRGP